MSSILNWIAHDEEEEEKSSDGNYNTLSKDMLPSWALFSFCAMHTLCINEPLYFICHTEVFANLNDNDLGLNLAFCAFYRNSVTES